jgi:hypothetical protein
MQAQTDQGISVSGRASFDSIRLNSQKGVDENDVAR